jgi:hypothetical protein
LTEGSPEGIQVPPIAEEEPLQGVVEISHEMESIDDLDHLGRPLDQTHHRPETPWDTQAAREPCTRAAAHREAHVPEGRVHAPTMAVTDRDEGRKPLGKNSLRTGGVPAEETTDLQMQDKPSPGQRQVGYRTPVGTMHRSGAVLTTRTRSRAPPAAEVHMPPAMHPARGPQTKMGEVRQQSV